MLACLRPAVDGDILVIDDQPTLEEVGDRLIWTDSFAYILTSALTRMGGGDPDSGDPMEVHELMVNLLECGPPRTGPHCVLGTSTTMGDLGQGEVGQEFYPLSFD